MKAWIGTGRHYWYASIILKVGARCWNSMKRCRQLRTTWGTPSVRATVDNITGFHPLPSVNRGRVTMVCAPSQNTRRAIIICLEKVSFWSWILRKASSGNQVEVTHLLSCRNSDEAGHRWQACMGSVLKSQCARCTPLRGGGGARCTLRWGTRPLRYGGRRVPLTPKS